MESRIETTLLTEERPVSFDFLEELVEQRVGPGILLLSPALKLMHMNRRAWELSRKITQAENGKAARACSRWLSTNYVPKSARRFGQRAHQTHHGENQQHHSHGHPRTDFQFLTGPARPQLRPLPALCPATEAGWTVNVDSCLCPFDTCP